MKYEIEISKKFKKQFKKLSNKKELSDRLLSAIKEVEEMEKHTERYKSYNSVEEMFEDLNK